MSAQTTTKSKHSSSSPGSASRCTAHEASPQCGGTDLTPPFSRITPRRAHPRARKPRPVCCPDYGRLSPATLPKLSRTNHLISAFSDHFLAITAWPTSAYVFAHPFRPSTSPNHRSSRASRVRITVIDLKRVIQAKLRRRRTAHYLCSRGAPSSPRRAPLAPSQPINLATRDVRPVCLALGG